MLDETTYYFTAFAIDQNNNIIDSETSSITTDFWWHVTPNTLAYFKIDENDTNSIVYDKTSNSYNATWYWTANYETLSTWKRVLNFTWSNGIYCWNKVFTTQPLTVSVWFYSKWNQSTDNTIVSNQRDVWSQWIVLAFGGASTLFTFFGNGSSRQTITNKVSISHNQWIHYLFTIEWWTIKKYMNWNLVQTVNGSWTPQFWNATVLSMWFLRTQWSQGNFRFSNIKLSDVILENVAWDSSKVADYYNKTKKYFV